MLNLNSIIIFSEHPKELVEFYLKVLQTEPMWSGGDFSGLKVGDGSLIIGPHSKIHGVNKNPERMLINFETADPEKEFERISKLGTKVIAKPYHPEEEEKMLVATFADPDDNYFQLVSPMDNP